MRRLQARGQGAAVVSRLPLKLPASFQLLRLDLMQERSWQASPNSTIISLLPLWILAAALPRFTHAQAVVAVSSTSRFGKASSSDPKERAVADNLATAEARLEAWGRQHNIPVTILRPTLIYDGRQDQNVARVARIIRRYGTFPIAAPGKGLRQPIHADDVAKAILGALDNPEAFNQAFNIAGGEILTYRAMVERIFAALGRKPRPLMLPMAWLERTFRLAARLGILRERTFGFAVFQRMNEDLVFDSGEGLRVLKYEPRDFRPEFSEG